MTEETTCLLEIIRHYRKYDEERAERGLEPVMGQRIRELKKEIAALNPTTPKE